MRIAMVTEYLAPKGAPYMGGVDARTINLARRLTEKHEVHIITSYLEGTERFEQYDAVIIHRVGRKRKLTQRGDFINRLCFNTAIATEIQRLKPDIVDASGFVAYSGSYRGASKIGVPVIATVHEVWQGEWLQNMGVVNGLVGHILERFYLRKPFDRYIAVSDFTKRKLINKLGIEKEKIEVIYNGVDLELYESILPEAKYPDPTVVTVCRLVEYKRVSDLIRAVALLRPRYPNLKLKIIGNGPEEESLRKLTRELDLEQNIEFLGKISDFTDVIKILKRSHIFALASITEGFGMVIIEAMASGIPYVASNIPPIYEVTEGGTGGILCTPKNCVEFAESIEKLLADKRTYDEKVTSINGYIGRYNWASISAIADQFYRRILSGDS